MRRAWQDNAVNGAAGKREARPVHFTLPFSVGLTNGLRITPFGCNCLRNTGEFEAS